MLSARAEHHLTATPRAPWLSARVLKLALQETNPKQQSQSAVGEVSRVWEGTVQDVCFWLGHVARGRDLSAWPWTRDNYTDPMFAESTFISVNTILLEKQQCLNPCAVFGHFWPENLTFWIFKNRSFTRMVQNSVTFMALGMWTHKKKIEGMIRKS